MHYNCYCFSQFVIIVQNTKRLKKLTGVLHTEVLVFFLLTLQTEVLVVNKSHSTTKHAQRKYIS